MRLIDADSFLERIWRLRVDSREAIAKVIETEPTAYRSDNMIDLDKLTLKEKLKLYAQGDWEQGLTPQGFRLSKGDVRALLKALDDSEKLQTLVDNVACVLEVAENIKNGGRIE